MNRVGVEWDYSGCMERTLILPCRMVHLDNSIIEQRVIPIMLPPPLLPATCVQLAAATKLPRNLIEIHLGMSYHIKKKV